MSVHWQKHASDNMLYVVKFIQIIYMVLYVQRVVSWQPYTLDQIVAFFAEAS